MSTFETVPFFYVYPVFNIGFVFNLYSQSTYNIAKVEFSTAKKENLPLFMYRTFCVIYYPDKQMHNIHILTINSYIVSTATCFDAKNKRRYLEQQNMQS